MEVRQLGPGLWRWTAEHPDWDHAENWGPDVGSVYAELPEAVVLIDPLVPADEEESFFAELDRDVERAGRPVHVLLTVHWHERSVAAVVERYRAKFWRPEENGDLPQGARAEVVKGSDWVEAMFFIEPHRALVVGDLLVGKDGGIELPISWFPKGEQEWARDELKPQLRARLGALPIERVLVSHGEPVLEDGGAALDRGLS
jgi:glyoxylase-like metal-dependent hydrolase (beta-lactamase superfamily II)